MAKLSAGVSSLSGSGLFGESSYVGINPITGEFTINGQLVIGGISFKGGYSDESGFTLGIGQGYISGFGAGFTEFSGFEFNVKSLDDIIHFNIGADFIVQLTATGADGNSIRGTLTAKDLYDVVEFAEGYLNYGVKSVGDYLGFSSQSSPPFSSIAVSGDMFSSLAGIGLSYPGSPLDYTVSRGAVTEAYDPFIQFAPTDFESAPASTFDYGSDFIGGVPVDAFDPFGAFGQPYSGPLNGNDAFELYPGMGSNISSLNSSFKVASSGQILSDAPYEYFGGSFSGSPSQLAGIGLSYTSDLGGGGYASGASFDFVPGQTTNSVFDNYGLWGYSPSFDYSGNGYSEYSAFFDDAQAGGFDFDGGYDPFQSFGQSFSDFGGFDFEFPVVLDLAGTGIKIDPLSSSNTYYDMAGEGYKHRTAWAGAGNGVLVLDLAGTGQITERNQVIFTDWDPTATSDMQALANVFDTNRDGKLDASDAQFASFRILVTNADGTTTLQTLAQAGVQSIDLSENAVATVLPDGSPTIVPTAGVAGRRLESIRHLDGIDRAAFLGVAFGRHLGLIDMAGDNRVQRTFYQSFVGKRVHEWHSQCALKI